MAAELPVIGDLKSHALTYARQGLEVFPVAPFDGYEWAPGRDPKGAKTPIVSQYRATTDVAQVTEWWDRWPDALIGHRLPEGQVIIDIDPRHNGHATWKALRAELGMDYPDTRLHVSGRDDGGGHVWYLRPEGKLTIGGLDDWAEGRGTGHRVEGADRWVCGLDLLHHTHRYTILPPSPHPVTGKPYRWHKWADVGPMPEALAELLIDTSPPPPPHVPKPHDGDSIADWYSATYGVADTLYKHGWHLRSVGSGDADGAKWQHPTASSPISATVRHGCLFVYSPNTPFDVTAPGDPNGYTPFRVFTVLEHGGDASAAARAARELKGGPARSATPAAGDFMPPPPRVDVMTGEIVADEPERPPVAVYWADDETDPPAPLDELVTNLVARGELTVLGAPRAMGKTWATMQLAGMCSEGTGRMFGSELLEVTQPATVVYLQGELGRAGSYGRWRLATNGRPPHVAEVFDRLKIRVSATKTSSTHDGITTTDEVARALVDHRLEPLLAELGADLLIVDPWATYFAGQENSNDETEAAVDALTQLLRRVDCAGWIVHHITAKATHGTLAEPEDLWRGASRLADAVATRVTLLPHYTPAKARELGLDRFQARRYGDLHVLQRNGPPVPVVHTQLEQFRWGPWDPPNMDGGRPPALSDRDVVDALRAGPITSKRKFAELLDVSHPTLDRHLERLIELQIVAIEDGPNRTKVYSLNDGGGLP